MIDDNDWTASLCDRVNEFLREHPVCAQVTNGGECSQAVQTLHGYAGSLKNEVLLEREGFRCREQVLENARKDAELRLQQLAELVWDTEACHEYPQLIGVADEIRSGNFSALDKLIYKL